MGNNFIKLYLLLKLTKFIVGFPTIKIALQSVLL